jgi:hypothetical protein
MTAVSHFRLLKVQQTGPPSFTRLPLALRWNRAVLPESIPVPDSYLNSGSSGLEVHSTVAAMSGTHLIPKSAAEPGAWTGDILDSTNSIIEGGMVRWIHR